MRVLLDTHVFLWANDEPERLRHHLELIEDPDNTRLVSTVTAIELAIKVGVGKLGPPGPLPTWFASRVDALVAETVPVEIEHALGVAELPLHHRDLFDRLLIAQARALRAPILTADRVFERYDVEVLLITT